MRNFPRHSRPYRAGMALLLSALVGGNVVLIRQRVRQAQREEGRRIVSRPTLGHAPPAPAGPAAQLAGGARLLTRPVTRRTPAE